MSLISKDLQGKTRGAILFVIRVKRCECCYGGGEKECRWWLEFKVEEVGVGGGGYVKTGLV